MIIDWSKIRSIHINHRGLYIHLYRSKISILSIFDGFLLVSAQFTVIICLSLLTSLSYNLFCNRRRTSCQPRIFFKIIRIDLAKDVSVFEAVIEIKH